MALDVLVSTDSDLERELVLLPLCSNLASLKDDAGALKIDTVLEELAKVSNSGA